MSIKHGLLLLGKNMNDKCLKQSVQENIWT